MTRKNLLGEVGGLITEPRDTAEPATYERPVDLLQPEPIGVVRCGSPEPIKKADGSRVHGRFIGGVSSNFIALRGRMIF